MIPNVMKRRMSMWVSWRLCWRYHCLTLWPCLRLAYNSTMPTPSTTSRSAEGCFSRGSAFEEMSVLVLAGLGVAVGLIFSFVLVSTLSFPRLGVGSPVGGQTLSLSWPEEMAAGAAGAVIGDAKSVLT